MSMKLYFTVLCMIGQLAVSAGAQSQGGVAVTDAIPVSVDIQSVFVSGSNTIQLLIRNHSHSQLTIDKASLQEPGFSITKEIGNSDGNIKDLCWGNTPGVSGGPSPIEIAHDFKRAVSILPGDELKFQIDPTKLLARVPAILRGSTVRVRLEFHNLVVATDGNLPSPNLGKSVFFSNIIDLPMPSAK